MTSQVASGSREPLGAHEVGDAIARGRGSSTRTVERALALLSEVCTREAVTLTECARHTGLPASTALRLLRTLESRGFISRDDDGGSFRAGPRMIQLGATSLGRNELARLARPALDRIGTATHESAYLSIKGVDETAIYIAQVEGTHAVRHSSWIGRAVPMNGLAVGRVLRGDIPPEGYVAGHDLLEPDVTAIVAPVRYPGGIAGALSVLGPTYRIDQDTMHAYGRIVATEAAELSARLGSVPDEQETRA
ncbi:IclR family transcriptional regulator [Marmoricola sp. URHB0036]|uniref:IclR family transcriptional regulator n=1 Tax=Marmoricola sp. URHB0036 TaxID=1298863 RepID=UPI000405D4EC|nr:IclR family transcriptional regulator [Marmoricola sp. URHB0036]